MPKIRMHMHDAIDAMRMLVAEWRELSGDPELRPLFFDVLLGVCTQQADIWAQAYDRVHAKRDTWLGTAAGRGDRQQQYLQRLLKLAKRAEKQGKQDRVKHKTQKQVEVEMPPYEPYQPTESEAVLDARALDMNAAIMGGVREIMMGALVAVDQLGSGVKGSPTFYKLREWAVDSYSAAAVEALLRDGHGPKEPPQIGHDLLSAAVFLVLAKPDSSCTATSLAPLISLATTVHKLILRALMMMGVMRLSEWHAWGGHTARQLLRQMLVVKSVLQSSIGCIHALLLQLQPAPT
ncbi:MAG: hypothetical protein WDW38_007535 [Sanguina aurantia]